MEKYDWLMDTKRKEMVRLNKGDAAILSGVFNTGSRLLWQSNKTYNEMKKGGYTEVNMNIAILSTGIPSNDHLKRPTLQRISAENNSIRFILDK